VDSARTRAAAPANLIDCHLLIPDIMATQAEHIEETGAASAAVGRARNFIGGAWVEPAGGEYFENRNPARQSEVIGLWPRSGAEDVQRAVAAAREGFERWRRTPAPERGAILKRVGDLLSERKEAVARAATREMGKVLLETRGDVQEGIDTAYYAATEGRRLFGHTVPSELRDKWAMSYRRPIGVAGLITPFNFPLAIPTWKMFPALVCGNSVILKPAEDVPHTATLLVEVLEEAGIPPGVVNLVHGFGEEVGAELVEHPDVPVISFTGSTETGRVIGRVCGELHKRLSLEMGGKNAQIVMPDADLELALDGVLWGAFGTTGQRCTATSRLLLHSDIHDEFLQRLADRATRLRLGYGVEDGVEVGPLINAPALAKVEQYIGIGREEGAELVCGGSRAGGDGVDDGFFFEPTIFANVQPGSRLATEEVFGPVLSVIRFSELDEAIRINNEVRYGLSSSVYTRDVRASFRALTELDNGITYINAPTIGAEAHLPFGGVKQTGNGHREGGWEVYEFYSETKVCYVDYSGKLQRAQIDNYDAGPY
jgi:alpha-ketoglutaric semialdehyde dehydrogenase